MYLYRYDYAKFTTYVRPIDNKKSESIIKMGPRYIRWA